MMLRTDSSDSHDDYEYGPDSDSRIETGIKSGIRLRSSDGSSESHPRLGIASEHCYSSSDSDKFKPSIPPLAVGVVVTD